VPQLRVRRCPTDGDDLSGYLNSQDGPSTAGLIVGDRLTALELLRALLRPSGCDAAYTAFGPVLRPVPTGSWARCRPGPR